MIGDMTAGGEVVRRRALPGDGVGLRSLEAKAALVSFPVPGDLLSAGRVERDVAAWLEPSGLAEFVGWFETVVDHPDHLWMVAEITDGPMVGFVHGVRGGAGVRLRGLYVDPQWWGLGVADGLMRAFDEWASDAAVGLAVLAHNRRAIRFYEKYGFIVDSSDGCIIPGVVTMSRPAVDRPT